MLEMLQATVLWEQRNERHYTWQHIQFLRHHCDRPTPMISLIIKAVLQPPSYCGATGVSGARDMIQRDSLTIKYPSRHATSVLMESETHDYIARAPHFNPQWLNADYRVSELCLGSSCISDCTSRNPSAHTSDRNSCFMPLLISRTRIEDDFKEIWCLLFCNSFPPVHIFNNDLLPCWICVHVCFSVSILRLHSWCQYFKQHVSVVFVFSWLSVQFGVTSCGDCLSFLGFSLCVI